MKKQRHINFVVDDLAANNLTSFCEKYNITQSEAIRRALWLLFDNYLEPEEQSRKPFRYTIEGRVEEVLREKGVI